MSGLRMKQSALSQAWSKGTMIKRWGQQRFTHHGGKCRRMCRTGYDLPGHNFGLDIQFFQFGMLMASQWMVGKKKKNA